MTSHKVLERILDHPDKDEIISKLIIDISEEDISSWLEAKYSGTPEGKKFVIAESPLKEFKKNYLDIYSKIKEDIAKAKTPDQKLQLALQDNSAYKSKILETASKNLDIEEKVTRLITNIEDRAAEVFDRIQGRDIDFKKDEVLIKYLDLLGSTLEKYYDMKDREETKKIGLANTVNNNTTTNVTIQVLDQQVSGFYQIFKEVLETLDFETSMRCIDLFNSKLTKLRQSGTKDFTLEQRVAEVNVLNDNIQKRLNE